MDSPTMSPLPPAFGPVDAVRPARRRRWWVIGGVAGWAVVLCVLALLSVWRDPPSIPEQRDLGTALPALDRATGAVLAAVGSDAVVEFGPLVVTPGCRITPIRDGAEAARDVTLHVRPGAGPTALRRIATDLPSSYGARVGFSMAGSGSTGSRLVLRADAGDYIAVHGTASADSSLVSVRSSTGCRPPGRGLPLLVAPGGSSDAQREPAGSPVEPPAGSLPPVLTAALTALRMSGAAATARELRCPDGRKARAVTVRGAAGSGAVGSSGVGSSGVGSSGVGSSGVGSGGVGSGGVGSGRVGSGGGDLDKVLAAVTAKATVVEARPEGYAYRIADESVLIAINGDQLRITATAAC